MRCAMRKLRNLQLSIAATSVLWLAPSHMAMAQSSSLLRLESAGRLLIASNREIDPGSTSTTAFSSRAARSLSFATVDEENQSQNADQPIRITVIDRADLPALFNSLAGRAGGAQTSVLVYVHGFNNTVESATYLAADVVNKMAFKGSVIVFAWPSRGGFLPSDYHADVATAGASTTPIVELLRALDGIPSVERIHVLAHSLGNDPLIKALVSLRPAFAARSKLGEIILCSPDIGRSEFITLVGKSTGIVRGATLWASDSDRALKFAEALGRTNRAGLISRAGPIIMNGVDTIDVSKEAKWFEVNHNAYRQVFGLFADLGGLLQTDRRRAWDDPDRRDNYMRMQTSRGVYWRYSE